LNLHKAKGGEEVIIQMEGGPEYRYRIVFGHRYVIDLQYDPAHDEANVIKMGELIEAANKPPGAEWITLITCSCEPGRLINIDANGLGECVDRDVVIAERIQ